MRVTSLKKKDVCIVFIDPHGDSAQKIRKFDLVSKDFNRLTYIDPCFSKNYTPCLNPFEFENRDSVSIELYIQQLITVFEEIIPDTKLSNYMKAILAPSIGVLLQN